MAQGNVLLVMWGSSLEFNKNLVDTRYKIVCRFKRGNKAKLMNKIQGSGKAMVLRMVGKDTSKDIRIIGYSASRL